MKAALITGAGRRVGAEIARDLARGGWHVVLHYNQSKDAATGLKAEIEAAGGVAALLGADLADAAQMADLVVQAFALAPGLELLVNNASIFAYDNAETTTAQALSGNFAVNAVAPILLSQEFARALGDDRTGCIVNMLDNRVFAPNPDYFSSGISKFALLGATRMMALALAPRVRVNAIAPGITLESGAQGRENYEGSHRMNPLGRGCTPGEIAAAVRLIAASPAMTGTIITIDGGLALANPGRDVAFIGRETQ